MKSNRIKFSILVPVYNVEKYVAKCIESIQNQTYDNYEVIIVDDGSTDTSGKICETICANDNRFHVYHKANGGLLHTRRYSLKYVTGDYILFVDSDDKLKIDALELLYKKLCIRRYDCIIYGYERVYNDIVVGGTSEDQKEKEISDKKELYRKVLFDENYNAIWRKAVKAQLLSDDYSNYYGVSKGEDLLQSLEIYKKGNNFLFIEDRLYQYTYNPQSITNKSEMRDLRIDYTVNIAVTEFIHNESVFSGKDMDDFLDYLSLCTLNSIYRIIESNLSQSEIRAILSEAWENSYYQQYLMPRISTTFSIIDRLFWKYFYNKKFKLLIRLGSIRKRIKKILNKY